MGNGFDLHYRIPSSYVRFGEYLKDIDSDVYEAVETYLAFDEDFWSYFEARLADFDVDTLTEEPGEFFVNYSSDEWSDSYHHDYQYEIQRVVEALSVGLKKRFTEWVGQLHIPAPSEIAGPLVRLDTTALFLTFNYTPTLQWLHGIPEGQVLHIHGAREAPDHGLVLGHGWDPQRNTPRTGAVDPEEDTRIMEGDELINGYFKDTFKPTKQIIERHAAYFAQLRGIDHVSVLGHSMADVDLPYFHEIVNHIDKDRVTWKLSYFGNCAPLQAQFVKLNLNPTLAQFATLAEF